MIALTTEKMRELGDPGTEIGMFGRWILRKMLTLYSTYISIVGFILFLSLMLFF